jgi:retron-type reverse transcriptase
MAELDNLTCAFHRAARGKATRPEVRAFRDRLDANLAEMGEDIRSGALRLGGFRAFRIYDPKPRVIHAPVFRDRVIHHALMRQLGPIIERRLVDDTFACREGKGALAAVHRAQAHHRRFRYFVKVDMRSYFASIDHAVLSAQLRRLFKHPGTLRLLAQVLASHDPDGQGRGLPIGALTSQHFANLYLAPLDRFLLERLRVRGMVPTPTAPRSDAPPSLPPPPSTPDPPRRAPLGEGGSISWPRRGRLPPECEP